MKDSERNCGEKEAYKNRFREWGKMGCRPPLGDSKTVKFNLKMTEAEREKIKKIAASYNLSMAEFMRKVSLGVELKPAPTKEETLELETLISYHTNFGRIGNWFKHDPSNRELLEEITKTRKSIQKYVYDRIR